MGELGGFLRIERSGQHYRDPSERVKDFREFVVAPPAEAVGELTDGLGADVVFEAVGVPATIEQAIAAAAPGGRVVIVGVTDRDAEARFRPQDIFWKELTIIGSREWTHGTVPALRWLSRLDLEPIITHEFPLAEVQTAIDLALTGQAGKVLLHP